MDEHGARGRSRAARLAFWGFALVALYFLEAEHRAHLFGALPYLLLAACPLMHLFHHHGGQGHRHDNARENVEPESRPGRSSDDAA
ncbi:DUF2933 domain-containing protein [Massilia sp. H-1]|nr:DUF2933 domain-containing protein [Massilia sp. H-1]